MPRVTVEGASIHLEEIGEGPTALVLHGGLGVDHTMYRTLDPLSDGLRLVYMDHRGNGRSTGDPAEADMARWSADVAAVSRSVAPDEQVILIGHSYGGFIAQETMISHPEIVGAAVLLNTTPGQLGTDERPAPEGPAMPAELERLFSEVPEDDAGLAETMSRLVPFYLHRGSPEAIRSSMGNIRFSARAMMHGFEVLSTWSSVDRLGEVEVPVLLVAGRHDVLTSWPQSDRIASRLPDAEVTVFENSGHMPWLDEPEEFFAQVLTWLDCRGLLEVRNASESP